MNRSNSRRYIVDILFVLTLFAVFSISMVFLLATGSDVYKNVVDSIDENYDARTSGAYLINKIRQGDEQGSISIGTFGGNDAVIISEEVDNVIYCTYLYSHDGYIKELYTRQSLDFDPSLGNNIMPIDDFKVERITDTLYSFDITTSEKEQEKLFVHIKSGS